MRKLIIMEKESPDGIEVKPLFLLPEDSENCSSSFSVLATLRDTFPSVKFAAFKMGVENFKVKNNEHTYILVRLKNGHMDEIIHWSEKKFRETEIMDILYREQTDSDVDYEILILAGCETVEI